MRFLINMMMLHGAGSAEVGKNLLYALLRKRWEGELHAYVPTGWRIPPSAGASVIHFIEKGYIKRAYGENILLRKESRRDKKTCIITLGDCGVLFVKAPQVLFVQQAFIGYEPEDWGFSLSGKWAFKMSLLSRYFAYGMGAVNYYIVQTSSMKRAFCRRWNIEESRVQVVPSAISVPIETQGLSLKERMFSQPYISCIGTWGPQKNWEIIPDIMAALNKIFPELLCCLTLNFDDAQLLRAKAEKKGVLKNLVFLGSLTRNQIVSLLDRSVALVMPSKLESFGLPIYEAMARGTPVIAAKRDYSLEAMGNTGCYADMNEAAEFADKIICLLTNEGNWNETRREQQKFFIKNALTWENIADKFCDIGRRALC